MSLRPPLTGLALVALMLALAALPAHAQLGSMNNPPPQHLFTTPAPQRLDNGLGTMAERRRLLAEHKRGQRAAKRPVTHTR